MEDKLKVIGPTDITEMVKGKTRIILISDYHDNYKVKSCKKKKDSILTTELIENLISKDKNKQWDFYLEQGSRTKSFFFNRYYSSIQEMKENYFNCKKSNSKEKFCINLEFVFYYFASKGCFLKKKCIHDNTRFHFIDIRQDYFNNINFYSNKPESFLKLDLKFYIFKFYKYNDRENIKDLINHELFLILKNLKSLKKLINRNRKNNKIMKQILKSEQSESIYSYFFELICDYEEIINLLIKKFNKNNINKFSNSFIKILENFKSLDEFHENFEFFNEKIVNIIDNFFGKDLEKVEIFYEKNLHNGEDDNNFYMFFVGGLEHLMGFYVDLYTLGRMFRKFDGKKQKNIIVLAGQSHIDRYKEFLKSIKFKTKFVSEKENIRCQVIPNIL